MRGELTRDRVVFEGRRLHVKYKRFQPATLPAKAQWWGSVRWKGSPLLTYRTQYGGPLNLINRKRVAR
jgi:hypothetical protein